jgi:hypothetical protein
MPTFNAIHARAKLIPTAAQIAVANAEVQQDFLFMLARVHLPADFPQSEEQREERLLCLLQQKHQGSDQERCMLDL